MESLFFSPLSLAVFFTLYTVLKLPYISRKRWARIGGVASAILFLVSLLGLSLRLHSGTVAQYDTMGNMHHGEEVLKITNQVEQLLEGGDYDMATKLLKGFNEDYPAKARSINELRMFVDDLLKERKIPAEAHN